MEDNPIDELISIIEGVRLKIKPDTDLVWTYHKTVPDLLAEMAVNMARLRAKDTAAIRFFEMEFAPTGSYQEIAIAQG